MGWNNVPRFSDNRRPRFSDFVDLIEFPNKDYKAIRLFGPIALYSQHSYDMKGKKGGPWTFMAPCINFNPLTGSMDNNGCFHCANGNRPNNYALQNAIDRSLQANFRPGSKELLPEEMKPILIGPSKFKIMPKKKGSPLLTPVRVFRAPSGVIGKLQDIQDLYQSEGNSGDFDDVSGCDIKVRYNKDEKNKGNMYNVAKGANTTITKAERQYPMWDIFNLLPVLTPEEQESEFQGDTDGSEILAKDNERGGQQSSDRRSGGNRNSGGFSMEPDERPDYREEAAADDRQSAADVQIEKGEKVSIETSKGSGTGTFVAYNKDYTKAQVVLANGNKAVFDPKDIFPLVDVGGLENSDDLPW